MSLLDPDIVLEADAGPARRAAKRPATGAGQVLQYVKGVRRPLRFSTRPGRDELPAMRLLEVNATHSLVLDLAGSRP